MLSFVNKLGIKEVTVWWLLVVVVGIAIYGSSWHSPFVLDDIHSIVQDEARRSIDWKYVDWLGTRTVSYFTLDVNYAWGGLAVEGYHAVNIAIHLITTILVTSLLYLIGRRTYKQVIWQGKFGKIDNHWLLALIGGGIFLAHPIQTQSVNYIVQRMVLLTTMFYVAAIVGYWRWRENKNKKKGAWWAIASLICSVLAMHTKEIAFTLPIVIVLVEYNFFAKSVGGLVRRWWIVVPWLLTMLIIPAYMLGVRDVFVHDAGVPPEAYDDTVLDKVSWGRIGSVSAETKEVTRQVYFVTQWPVIVKYIRLIIWPVGLNIDHNMPWQEQVGGKAIGSMAVILGVMSWGVWLQVRRRIVGALGIAIFFLALSVESSIIPIKDNIFEHRLYLPMVGVVLLAVEGLAWCWSWTLSRGEEGHSWWKRIVVTAIVMLVIFSGLSYMRNGVWRSALSLWSDAVTKSPQKARPMNNLGLALEEVGRKKEAENTYRRGLESNPDNVEMLINLGALLGKTNRTEEAVKVLQRAVELKPDLASSYVNLGNVYMLRRQFNEAANIYAQALLLKGKDYSLWASWGDALIGQGRNDEAIAAYEQVMRSDQPDAMWLNRLGALYARAGRYQEAKEVLTKALVIDPQLMVARTNLKKLEREN